MRGSTKALILVTLYIVISLVFIAPMAPSVTEYQYEVKAQQAFDVDRVDDSDVTDFDDLEADEQELLYRAFKKSDHFMGESEVTIHTDEQLDTFTDWRTVESNGIVLLVAVDETREEHLDSSVRWAKLWGYSMLVAIVLFFLFGLLWLFPPP